MSRNSKKSMGSTIILILLGILALFGGIKSLFVLIPAAILIWFGIAPTLRGGRN